MFQTFRLVTFELTDEYGTTSSSAPYYEYFDSITWTSDCRDMPYIKMYWQAEHSNMALVLKEDKDEPMNSEYYVRAEPK